RVPTLATLDLTPEQREKLARFGRTHTFSMALCGPGDDANGPSDPRGDDILAITADEAESFLGTADHNAGATRSEVKILQRIARGLNGPELCSLLYRRPLWSQDERNFSDLVAYAPGMNTSQPDIQAMLEAEAAPNPRTIPGHIDPAARKLIDQARATGWQS